MMRSFPAVTLGFGGALYMLGCVPLDPPIIVTPTPTSAPAAEPITVDVSEFVEQIVIQPSGARAQWYADLRAHELLPEETVVLEQLREHAPHFIHDPSLSALARDFGRFTPSYDEMPPSLITNLLIWNGLVDPDPTLYLITLDDLGCLNETFACFDRVTELVTRVVGGGGQSNSTVGVGVAIHEGEVRVVVATVRRSLLLQPLDIKMSLEGRSVIRGQHGGAQTNLRLERIDARERWSSTPIEVLDGSFVVTTACDAGAGIYQVEILGEGVYGPEVLANFSLFCEQDPPTQITYERDTIYQGDDLKQVTDLVYALLNRDRRQHGVQELAWDEAVATVAEGHSEDMRDSRYVGHISSVTGDAGQRLREAGINGRLLRENVARGYGAVGIHYYLMHSPAHRKNILAPDVTHVGIGVAVSAPQGSDNDGPLSLYLTQNFVARSSDPTGTLRDTVDQDREFLALPPIAWHPGLSKVAEQQATRLARGEPLLTRKQILSFKACTPFHSFFMRGMGPEPYETIMQREIWRSMDGVARVGVGVYVDEETGNMTVVVLGGREHVH
jgi:uncharacterized protein YkwD